MRGTILLIDDEIKMHKYSKSALVKAGYEMISAFDGPQGLEMVREYKPDLILLDYMMPGMNGYDVYEEIIRDKPFSSIPIIMLTALNEKSGKKAELFQKGLAAYLNKPFGHKELINVIENILYTNKIKIKNQQLHQAIKDAKDFLENLINSSPDAIITMNMKGIITSFSQGAEEVFGYPAKEVIEQSFLKYLPSCDNNWPELLKNESTRNYETKFLSKSKKYIPVSFSISLLKGKDNNNIGLLAIGKDLSELKKLENELVEKEKLAILMETAVAINHEINNPLTPILGNTQLLLDNKKKLPDWVVKKLVNIEKNAWRIQQIVQKLNRITQPVKKRYCGDTQMLDIELS